MEAMNQGNESDKDGQLLQGIIDIFEEVLGVNPVNEDDHFFHLGGHSLIAIRVVARLHSTFGIQVPVRAIFDHSTPIGLAEHIRQMGT